MSSRNTFYFATAVILLVNCVSQAAFAQADQYKREKPAAKKAAPKGDGKTPTPAPDDKSDKLDISDLEQKYWAPKDTDFSVVQNRTYTKAGRVGVSLMTGPILNDTFSEGFNNTLKANYYFDERYGVEFSYIQSELSDTDEISNFRQLSGGGVNPDYNREDTYMGVGFNWVPIYAKVSLLGKKILYFDLQVTPHIGMSSYLQQTDGSPVANNKKESAFTYGVDITQFYFLSNEIALRFDIHNRWYTQDVLAWNTGVKSNTRSHSTQMFLFGVTYFF
jgi:outer membrane beta-barrel protein